MKTLKVMLMSVALLVVCGFANAGTKIAHDPNKDEAVNIYVNAVVHGNLTGIDNAIDEDAQFNTARGERVSTLNKGAMLDYLKANAADQPNCKCTETVLTDDGDKYVKKVVMQNNDVTRTDVVTAEHVGSGWKITRVETSYK
jgi:hypothetical protein